MAQTISDTINTQSYPDSVKQSIIDVMKEHNTLPPGFGGDADKYFWDLAKKKHPKFKLPDYKDTFEKTDSYPADPESLTTDIEPNKVNILWESLNKTVDNIWTKLTSPPEYKPIFSEKEGFPLRDGKPTSVFEGLVDPDSWMKLDIDDDWQNAIKVGINSSTTGALYEIQAKKSRYDINMEEYNPEFSQMLLENVIAYGDPLSLMSMYASYAYGGIKHVKGFRNLKNIPKILEKWWGKATGRHIVRTIPKTKQGNAIKSKLTEVINSEGFENIIYGVGGLGTMFAVTGGIHSAAEQRMNRGKYQNNNGTIKPWDTMNDMWKSYKHGATTGLLVHVTGKALGTMNLWANKNWQMGAKNYKTFLARMMSSKPVELGIQGTILTGMPLALDKEAQKSYYDEDGNFDWKKFGAGWVTMTGLMYGLWGVQKATQPRYRGGPNWEKDVGRINGSSLPVEYNFAKEIRNIKSSIVPDIKYENNKLIDKGVESPTTKMYNQSVKNVKNDLGLDMPFDFFESDIGKETELIETVEGLKTVREIVEQTIKIQEKAGVKNDKGDYIDVDLDKLTDDDIFYVSNVSPTAVSGYQGYRMKFFESEEGQQEYIQRYEKEQNKGKKLTESEKKVVLLALENRINRYDNITHDLNKSILEGNHESEQIVREENKSELDKPQTDVIVIDKDGVAVTGEVLSINSEQAEKGIEDGAMISRKDAEEKGVEIKKVESLSVGSISPEEYLKMQKESIAEGVKEGISAFMEEQRDYSINVPRPKSEVESIIENVVGNELIKKVDTKSKIDNIKDKYDIAALDKSLTTEEMNKWLGSVNKLLKHSGHTSITDITPDDITSWLDSVKKSRAKKGKLEAIPPKITSDLRLTFKNLQEAGYIKISPARDKILKPYTTEFYEVQKEVQVEAGKELPTMKSWFDKMPQVYKKIKSSKSLSLATTLLDRYPIRVEEVNHLRGEHVKLHPSTGAWYIDLLKSIKRGGAAKTKGKKRPLWIPKELAFSIQRLAKTRGVNNKLFPKHGEKITQTLKNIEGFPENITSRAYKRQLKTFADRYANLTDVERQVYNMMAGHAEPTDQKILDLYRDQANWGDLFKLQKQVLNKIQDARMALEGTTGPFDKFVGKIVEGLQAPGLRIEDVSGKNPKEVVDLVKKEAIKEEPNIDKDVKKVLIKSVNEEWDAITGNMDVILKKDLLQHLAGEAGIEDYVNFGTRGHRVGINDDYDDIVSFYNQFGNMKSMSAAQTIRIARTMRHTTLAKDILRIADYNIEAQKRLLRDTFKYFPEDTPLSQVNFLSLTEKQSKELLSVLHEKFGKKDPQQHVLDAFNHVTIEKISDRLPWHVKARLPFGFMGQVEDTFPWIAKITNIPEIKTMGENIINHDLLEIFQGSKLGKMEQAIWKMIYDDAITRGVSTKFKMITSIEPTAFLRKSKRKYIYGKKIWDKEVKNNIWALSPYRYEWLKEHVKNNPTDKVAIKRLKNANKFYNDVYVTESNYKELGLKKQAVGSLRLDTLSGKIAKRFFEYTKFDTWDNVKLAFRDNMTDAQFEAIEPFLKEIRKYFYVPQTTTKEFIDNYKNGQIMKDRERESLAIEHAKELAQEHYKTKAPTDKQVKKFLAKGRIEAGTDLVYHTQSPSNFKTKHFFRRQRYLGERQWLPIKGKWVDTYEHEYDNYMPAYNSSMSKTIANIQYFPWIVNIPKIKFVGKYSMAFDNLLKKGGWLGFYVHSAIMQRTGVRPPPNTIVGISWEWFGKKIQTLNKFVSRGHLSGIKSAGKNYRLALTQNFLRFDISEMVHTHLKAMQFEDRMEARAETGMLGASYVSLTENDNDIISRVMETLFTTMRFPTTEAAGRVGSMYATKYKLPKVLDGVRDGDPVLIDYAKDVWALTDSELEDFKRYGLGTGEVDWMDKESVKKKGIHAKRFKDIKDDVLLQRRIDMLHHKILTRSHIMTQGSISDPYQPWIMQDPVFKGLAMYTQTAIDASHNTYKAFADAKRNGNWHRIAAWYGLGVLALTAQEFILYDRLIKQLPDPFELDRKWFNILARIHHRAEMGGTWAWMWGIANNEFPLSNPVLPSASPLAGWNFLQTLGDAAKWGIEKTGIEAFKTGPWARYFIRDKRFGQSIEELGKNQLSLYRDIKNSIVNWNHPYRVKQTQIEDLERGFYNHAGIIRPSKWETTVMSPYYKELKDIFETSENWNEFNEMLVTVWFASYTNAININGETPKGAELVANNAIGTKLGSMNPILNGTGKLRGSKWHSTRERYTHYAQDLAIDQKRDKNYWVDKLKQQEAEYLLRIAGWKAQWPGWIQHNYKTEEHKNSLKRITPLSWEKLNIK